MDEEDIDSLYSIQENLTEISEQLSEIILAKKFADKIDRIIRGINDLIDQESSSDEDDDSWC